MWKKPQSGHTAWEKTCLLSTAFCPLVDRALHFTSVDFLPLFAGRQLQSIKGPVSSTACTLLFQGPLRSAREKRRGKRGGKKATARVAVTPECTNLLYTRPWHA